MGAVLASFPRFIRTDPSTHPERRRTTPYKYPPNEGSNYFGSHFYLGNCKFNSISPEAFLFGENNDLNYLGSHPITFPYKADKKLRATKTLRSLINVQKDSVKIVKTDTADQYTLEFVFDSDVDCCFRVLYSMPDTTTIPTLTNELVDESVCKKWSPPYSYKAGAGQTFSQPDHVLCGSEMMEVTYDVTEGGNYPLVIMMETVDTISSAHQLQLTLATIDKFGEDGHTLKVLKQILCVDQVVYILQEIYGLENKCKEEETNEPSEDEDDEFEDALEESSECVICFSEVRDTLILPCRHFCICTTCAASLRYQASNCPICRAPFHALLSLTALQEIDANEDEITDQQSSEVPGYKSLPLVQALNGYPVEQQPAAAAGVVAPVGYSTEELESTPVEYIFQNGAEKVEDLPIEVPFSPPANGHVPLELDLPGTPERSREYDNFNTSHHRNFCSSENDMTDVTTLSSSSKDLSETSSNHSGESSTLLLSSSSKSATSGYTNNRNSVKKKSKFNTEQEFEMSVIHNGKVVHQDNPTAAEC